MIRANSLMMEKILQLDPLRLLINVRKQKLNMKTMILNWRTIVSRPQRIVTYKLPEMYGPFQHIENPTENVKMPKKVFPIYLSTVNDEAFQRIEEFKKTLKILNPKYKGIIGAISLEGKLENLKGFCRADLDESHEADAIIIYFENASIGFNGSPRFHLTDHYETNYYAINVLIKHFVNGVEQMFGRKISYIGWNTKKDTDIWCLVPANKEDRKNRSIVD